MTLAEQAERALRVVREAPVIAYDTETSGLDWRIHQPVGYVITESAENNFYIPVRHGGGGNLVDPNCGPMTAPNSPTHRHQFEVELAKAFEERRAKKLLTVGHNLKFDMHASANQGIFLGRDCEDTSVNQALINEYMRSFSLEACAEAHKVTPKKGDELYALIARIVGGGAKAERKVMEHFWRTAGNAPEVVGYTLGDGITTLELWKAQQHYFTDPDDHGRTMELIHRIESRLIWTIFRMERRGIKVDEQYIEALVKAVDEEMEAATRALPAGFNVRSGPQMLKLFQDNGLSGWPTTPSGNPSFPESYLKKSELGRAVIQVRQLSNLKNTFVGPLVDTHIWNGRVHANLNQIKSDDYGTVAGRFSCSDPNLQAIHKRNKVLGRRFRQIFVADEGYDYNEDDYSQCEPRLFAHYSGEPALVEGYNQDPPRDMHAVVAEMFQVERDPTAKRMNMGILTGMQPKTFAGHMDWTLDQATIMHRQWFEGFPGIAGFQRDAKTVFLKRGYVRTLLGRVCHLDDPRFAYRGTSRIIQGGNADIIKAKLLEIDEWLEAEGDVAFLQMTVHDSINYSTPKGELGEAISLEIRRIATNVQCEPFNLKVPFIMDHGSGPNWAIATYGPEK